MGIQVGEGCISPKHSLSNPELRHLLGFDALKTSVRPKHDEIAAPSISAQPIYGERRRLTRKHVMLQGEISWPGASHPVRLGDLSSGGTLIKTDVLPSVGSYVKLTRQGHAVHARIAWKAQGRSGLEFREPTDVATLLRPIVHRRSAAQPRFRRPPLDRRYMSEIDKQWNEQPPLSWAGSGLSHLPAICPTREHQGGHTGHEPNDAHAERRERIWRLSQEINRRLFSYAQQLQRFD